jgi:hypothetical protein
MRNGGEAQYDPPPLPQGPRASARAIRPSRKADRPQWMDRVWPRASSDEALNDRS